MIESEKALVENGLGAGESRLTNVAKRYSEPQPKRIAGGFSSLLKRTVPLLMLISLSGCSLVERVGIRFFYRGARWPENRVIRNMAYTGNPLTTRTDQKLDVYLPEAEQWPVLIFVHGGGWTEGDKDLRVGGVDVYGNIGRFYASKGIGVVNVNYRLQPTVGWSDQVDDLLKAVTWTEKNIARYGGDPKRIYLSGHSAGAHLATYAAFLTDVRVKGVIAVSGAGYDMTDRETHTLGADPRYYEQRFRGDGANPRWREAASPLYQIPSTVPPFLILYAGGEKPPLKRQARLLDAALQRAGHQRRLIEVPGESHSLIVLALSHPKKRPAHEILRLINETAP